jgi:hypothetical protein
MSVSPAEACLPNEELFKLARARLLAALANAASAVLDVQVTSLKVNTGGLACPLPAGSSPTIEFEALIIFADDGSKPFVDLGKLQAVPTIISVAQIDSSPVVSVVESAPAPPAEAQPANPPSVSQTPTASSNSSMLVIVAGVAGAVAVVAVAAALVMWYRSGRSKEAALISAAVHDKLAAHDKIEQTIANVTWTVEGGSNDSRGGSFRKAELQV